MVQVSQAAKNPIAGWQPQEFKPVLVGGLEHEFYLSIQLGVSSSQLTKSYFSEGLVNHQPELYLGWTGVIFQSLWIQILKNFWIQTHDGSMVLVEKC